MRPAIIGITGRSGSGKTTLVHKIVENLGQNNLAVHSLDDYYLKRNEQIKDDTGYLNFDLPSSFDREVYFQNLLLLMKGEILEIVEYSYNEADKTKSKLILPAPIILVEGLFINHFSEIDDLIDYNIYVKLDKPSCYERRLYRDTHKRNYEESEVYHRFNQHAEPAYLEFITPYEPKSDLILINDCDYDNNINFHNLISLLSSFIKKRGEL